jgi:L-asparaginase II
MTETSGMDHGKVAHGIDGCSIFTYAIPLQNLAVAGSYFLRKQLPEKRAQTLKRIIAAVGKHPLLVSGHDDFGNAVMEETAGRCLVKHGAEGVVCCILLDKDISIAVKVADGAARAAQVAAAAVLLHYGGLTENQFKKLGHHCQPPIKDWNGAEVGAIKVAAK